MRPILAPHRARRAAHPGRRPRPPALARLPRLHHRQPRRAVGVTVRRGTTECNTARAVLSRYLHTHGPCGGSACTRTISGRNCAAASPANYPRVASCGRGRQLIEAIANND